MAVQEIDKNTLYLIYDDECPLCRNAVHAVNIKKAVSNLVLINARDAHPLIDLAYHKGFDLDQGMLVIYNNQYFYGADAVHFLAVLDSSSRILNKIMVQLLRSHRLTKIIYPVIKSIRRLLLKIRGVEPVTRNS